MASGSLAGEPQSFLRFPFGILFGDTMVTFFCVRLYPPFGVQYFK